MNKVLITSQGRTATLSLNTYLNQLPQVRSFHERNKQDVPFLFYSQLVSYKKLMLQHLQKEEDFVCAQKSDHVVLINPYFRFVGNFAKEQFEWKVAHLVRNPKTYLESVYIRNTFTPDDLLLNQLPKDQDPFATRWALATRFEKLCWYYSNTLSYFAISNIKWYQFEQITENPVALHAMLQDLNLPVDKTLKLSQENSGVSLKAKLAGIKAKGLSNKSTHLNWDSLSDKERNTYHELLDDLAKYFGYVL